MKSVIAVMLAVIAAQAMATDKPTLIPSLALLPLVVTVPGELTTANVANWGAPMIEGDGAFNAVNRKLVTTLEGRKCTLALPLEQKAIGARYFVSGSKARLSCISADGRNHDVSITGSVVDASGMDGLATVEVAAKGYFMVHASVDI